MLIESNVLPLHQTSDHYTKQAVSRVTILQTLWNSMTFTWRFAALLPMLSVTHVKLVLVLFSVVQAKMQQWSKNNMKRTSSAKSRMDANMQLTINSFRLIFPDKIFSRTLSWLLVKSLTAVKFTDIYRFSRQVVTLSISIHLQYDAEQHPASLWKYTITGEDLKAANRISGANCYIRDP